MVFFDYVILPDIADALFAFVLTHVVKDLARRARQHMDGDGVVVAEEQHNSGFKLPRDDFLLCDVGAHVSARLIDFGGRLKIEIVP